MSQAQTRIVKELEATERWQSTIDGVIWIHKFDRNGKEIEEQVKGGGAIRLLPEERQMNQEMCAEASLDPFLNGHLIPLKLVDTADDYEELKGNPNHITEEDMRGLLKNPKAITALKDGVAKVSNPSTLQRLLAIANDPDSDATVKQVKVIEARLSEVRDLDAFTEIEQIGGRDIARTTAPSSKAPRNPGMGRR